MVQTVKEFVNDAYQLITAQSPTVPLAGNDFNKGLQFLNELIASYSGTGLLLTVATEVSTNVVTGQMFVEFAASGGDVNIGRLANIEDAYLTLTGVTYPLIPVSIHSFNEQYKYAPLQGLPIYAIILDQINETRLQLYPAPSQAYGLTIVGKFELASLNSNSNMAGLPNYYQRFLKLALARDLAFYKARSEAWTDKLDKQLLVAMDDMESVSEINLNVTNPIDNQLNGAYRVRAGI